MTYDEILAEQCSHFEGVPGGESRSTLDLMTVHEAYLRSTPSVYADRLLPSVVDPLHVDLFQAKLLRQRPPDLAHGGQSALHYAIPTILVVALNIYDLALNASDLTNAGQVVMRFFQLNLQPILPARILSMDGEGVQISDVTEEYDLARLMLFYECVDLLLSLSTMKRNVDIWYY